MLRHHTRVIDLPVRRVTAEEVALARREAARFAPDPAQRWNYLWNQSVVTRYELQQTTEPGTQKMELHVLRLGDVAVASNAFELFTDYGIPVTFYNDHYDLLLSQDFLFARKISPDAKALKDKLGKLYAPCAAAATAP